MKVSVNFLLFFFQLFRVKTVFVLENKVQINCTMSISPYNYTMCNSTWTCLNQDFTVLIYIVNNTSLHTRKANYTEEQRTTKFSWNKCDCVEIPLVGLAKAQKGEIPSATDHIQSRSIQSKGLFYSMNH